VSRQGSVSEEIFRRLTGQERLPDAVSVDAAAWKSFRLRSKRGEEYKRLVVSLSVRNLLGRENMIYSGRESLRIYRRSIAGDYLYEPFPTRYTYAYPRTYYISVTYRF
jgi:outer membrane receptor protein involved in Fe transport